MGQPRMLPLEMPSRFDLARRGVSIRTEAVTVHRMRILDGRCLSGPKPSLSSRRLRERRSNTAFARCGGARLSHKLRI